MIRKREDFEKLEGSELASYAAKSASSKGRKLHEEENKYRICYQRDRDRIVHSTAFRRLQFKTQVFVTHEGDFYRTRMAHTLEVAQIAKALALYLGANEGLTEAIALAHDLGHTPFGHAGESELNDLMGKQGKRFEHNIQSLRVVESLESRYPNFCGLNLTWETREGLARHTTHYDYPEVIEEFSDVLKDFFYCPQPGFEVQIVNIADIIAYSTHDLDDALLVGFVSKQELEEWSGLIPVFGNCYHEAEGDVLARKLSNDVDSQRFIWRQTVRHLINALIIDVVETTERNLVELVSDAGCIDPDTVRQRDVPLVAFSQEIEEQVKEWSSKLIDSVYKNPPVLIMSEKARLILRKLFETFTENTQLLPYITQGKITEKTDKYRVVCDYLSGMTDRYAMDVYQMLFEPYEKTLLAFK